MNMGMFLPTRGLISFTGKKSGQSFLQWAIRFFTHSKYSHTFLTTFDICNVPAVEEASLKVQIIPFDRYETDPDAYCAIFVPKCDQAAIDKALAKVYNEFAGVEYGFLQIIWFIWRAGAKLFGVDVRYKKNWFTAGVICSELVYWYLFYLGPPFSGLVYPVTAHDDGASPDDVGNTIQPEDLYEIAKAHPEAFTKVFDNTPGV